VDLGMRIAEFQFSFRFVYYFFQSEIRNQKSENRNFVPLVNRQTKRPDHIFGTFCVETKTRCHCFRLKI
jgi:hypothetical protein